jgi:hypothetical protein
MDKAAFREFLRVRGLDEETAGRQLAIAEHLDTMLASRNTVNGSGCGKRAAKSLIDSLWESGQDTEENIFAILRYGSFIGNDEIYVEALTILDGREALDNLRERLRGLAGENETDRIFGLIGRVSPGTSPKEKASAMKTAISEAMLVLDDRKKVEFFKSSFRDLDDKYYSDDVELFRESEGIDEYIEAKRKEFMQELNSCMKEGRLFFGQEISSEVIKLVEADLEISFGRREGKSLFITKIPFSAKKWLEEKDPRMRRYYYCHCPWARESLLFEDGPVPAEFCRCSAGFHKKSWEVIFGKLVDCEVLESVLAGDDRCRFKLTLPI